MLTELRKDANKVARRLTDKEAAYVIGRFVKFREVDNPFTDAWVEMLMSENTRLPQGLTAAIVYGAWLKLHPEEAKKK